jgi:hypothetical protein
MSSSSRHCILPRVGEFNSPVKQEMDTKKRTFLKASSIKLSFVVASLNLRYCSKNSKRILYHTVSLISPRNGVAKNSF